MGALKLLVVVMGVMIVAGTAVLAGVIAERLSSAGRLSATRTTELTMNEPSGTQITGMALLPDRLALRLHGGGPDRVAIIDPRTGRLLARIQLAR